MKQKIIFTLITILALTLTITLESKLNKFEFEKAQSLFGSVNQSEILVKYKIDEDFTEYNADKNKLPLYIGASEEATFHAFEDAFLTLSENTELKTLTFNNNKLHLLLQTGEVTLDTRLSNKPVSVQVNNILVKPFQRGVIQISKIDGVITVASIKSQAKITQFNENGDQSEEYILPRAKQISFQGQLSASKWNPSKLLYQAHDIVDLDSKINFTLKYKGESVLPDDTKGFLASITKSLTLNDNKREFLSLYPFIQNLNQAKTSLLKEDIAASKVDLANAKVTFDEETIKNASAINSYQSKITEISEKLVGLNADNRLNPIKAHIINNYLKLVDTNLYLNFALSFLEDSAIYFNNDKTVEAEIALKQAKTLIEMTPSLDDETKLDLSTIVENLLIEYPEANFTQTYELLFSLTETTDYISQINRLKDYYEQNSLSIDKIKQSLTVLISKLDAADQRQFDDFLEELNIEGLKLQF